MTKSNASHVADLTRVIDTLTAERNALLGKRSPKRTDEAVHVKTLRKLGRKVPQRAVYGGRTAQILARPDMAAKELAALIGTHPRYVYKIRQANA